MKLFFSIFTFLFFIPFVSAQFSDSDQIPNWSMQAVETLYNENIISGNDDGTFAPERSMNRAEFCKIIVSATKTTPYLPLQSRFPDIHADDWFFEAIETAQKYGWVSGYPDGYFRPAGTINRAEVAKILTLSFGISVEPMQEGDDWSMPYFRALSEAGLLAYGTTLDNLGASFVPSRAEITEQIHRVMQYTGKLSLDSGMIQPSESTFDPLFSTFNTRPKLNESDANSTFYEYSDNIEATIPLNPNAGTLYIEKQADLSQNITVSRNAQNVLVHSLTFKSDGNPVTVVGFTFRHMGTAPISTFKKIWLEANNVTISKKISMTDEVVYLPLTHPLTIGKTPYTITLKADIGSRATPNKDARLVLYRPHWIDADSQDKVGFFPLGGIDVQVR